jgi:DNA-binding response OmpR family regulator
MTTSLEQNAVSPPTVTPALTAAISKTQAIRVLLVGADELHREALSDELSKQGFAVRSFSDSVSLLSSLQASVEAANPGVALSPEDVVCGKLVLKPAVSRAYWSGTDVGLTLGEYKIVHLLASSAGHYVTYRKVYDQMHYEGFIAGSGADGYRANVRSAIKRIRNKFHDCDPAFVQIENYAGFGYCWRKPD